MGVVYSKWHTLQFQQLGEWGRGPGVQVKSGLCGKTLLKTKWQPRMTARAGSDMRAKEESRVQQVQGEWRKKIQEL